MQPFFPLPQQANAMLMESQIHATLGRICGKRSKFRDLAVSLEHLVEGATLLRLNALCMWRVLATKSPKLQ